MKTRRPATKRNGGKDEPLAQHVFAVYSGDSRKISNAVMRTTEACSKIAKLAFNV